MLLMKRFFRLTGLLAMLFLAVRPTARAQVLWYTTTSIVLDNELGPDASVPTGDFYSNPLVLNGKPLDVTRFNIFSRGTLAMVKGNPESPFAEKIPFRIYLRRDGELITTGASNRLQQVFSVEISEVLKLSEPGDHLIIEPVRKTDRPAKRILQVIVVIGNDGC